MPTNLTHRYVVAEQAYRRANSIQEELDCLQVMLVEVPKHKGTDKLQGDLKQKISRVKKEIVRAAKNPSGKKTGFRLPRQGAGRAVIIGAPNSGKSQLVAALTNAKPEVAEYPFTTLKPMPAMMAWNDVYVQLVDTPPITTDLFASETQALIRGADVIITLLDLGTDDGGEDFNAMINMISDTKTRLGQDTTLDGNDIGVTYTKTLLALNKTDLAESCDRLAFFREFVKTEFDEYEVSGITNAGIEELRDAVYRALDVVRVYTKSPAQKKADMKKPFTIRAGGTLLDVAELIHHDLAKHFKSARVWGQKVHPGTPVKGDYVVQDGDVVEIST